MFEQGLFLLLRLLAAVYSLVVWLRDLSFRLGLRKAYRISLPVIAVGNLAVGGTGKTPLVDLLIRYVRQKGLRVAVVSRGYGGHYAGDLGIVSLGEGALLSADEAGDEPALLARRNPQAIVLVAAKRRIAIEYIEQNGCADLVIMDDAFQHRQVARDLNLVLLDAQKPFGNQYLLPAGLLREPKSALSRADMICLTGVKGDFSDFRVNTPVVRVRAVLSGFASSLTGEEQALAAFTGMKVVAFAGIGRPERFFSALEGAGISLVAKLALGDHVRYDPKVIAQINAASVAAEILMTTEKDAIKLAAEDFYLPCFSVGLDVSLTEESILFDRLDHLIEKGCCHASLR
ncbi:MAG: tetraacyldisaccharide 4'-kinase [Geopsychrobacter sp.]|nr:tetraacyldisaccharide 4'-kinase [Geopsychrobacter sp.]